MAKRKFVEAIWGLRVVPAALLCGLGLALLVSCGDGGYSNADPKTTAQPSENADSSQIVSDLIAAPDAAFFVTLAPVDGVSTAIIWRQGDGIRRWDELSTTNAVVGYFVVEAANSPISSFGCVWQDIGPENAQVSCSNGAVTGETLGLLSQFLAMPVGRSDGSHSFESYSANCYLVGTDSTLTGRVCVEPESMAPLFLQARDTRTGLAFDLQATSLKDMSDSLVPPFVLSSKDPILTELDILSFDDEVPKADLLLPESGSSPSP